VIGGTPRSDPLPVCVPPSSRRTGYWGASCPCAISLLVLVGNTFCYSIHTAPLAPPNTLSPMLLQGVCLCGSALRRPPRDGLEKRPGMGGSSAGDLVRAAVPDWSPCGVWPVRFECVGGTCGCGVAVISLAALRWVYNRGVCCQTQENSARTASLSPPTVDPCVPVALARA